MTATMTQTNEGSWWTRVQAWFRQQRGEELSDWRGFVDKWEPLQQVVVETKAQVAVLTERVEARQTAYQQFAAVRNADVPEGGSPKKMTPEQAARQQSLGVALGEAGGDLRRCLRALATAEGAVLPVGLALEVFKEAGTEAMERADEVLAEEAGVIAVSLAEAEQALAQARPADLAAAARRLQQERTRQANLAAERRSLEDTIFERCLNDRLTKLLAEVKRAGAVLLKSWQNHAAPRLGDMQTAEAREVARLSAGIAAQWASEPWRAYKLALDSFAVEKGELLAALLHPELLAEGLIQ